MDYFICFCYALFYFTCYLSFRAIDKADIQLKISVIEKLSFKNEELIERHRTLEQQFYDIKILNKKLVEEKEKLKKEFNDLLER